MLENFFALKKRHTSVKTELLAGMTTFFTMIYIVVVNPAILSAAGVPFNQAFMATIIASVIGTAMMALLANHPIAIAPGMGLNAYFASVAAAEGLSYQTVFGAVFIAGLIFLLLSITALRETLIRAIPDTLKNSITAGIGLFIAFIGLRMSGIVAAHPANLVALGDLHHPSTLLALFGLFVTLVLIAAKVKASLFFGMAATAVLGYFTGFLQFEQFVSLPPAPVLFDLDIAGVFQHGLYAVVFSFLLVTLFDTTGTMIGVAKQAGLMRDGQFPRAKAALSADATATAAGAALGTSPTTAYIESATGVAAGGRTGLTALVVAGLFLVSMFFFPAIQTVSGLSAITAPALIIVGSLMIGSLANIAWSEFDEAFPAFAILIAMPLTSSIATGISFGFITYPLMKLVSGKARSVHPLLYVFGALFLLQMIFWPNH